MTTAQKKEMEKLMALLNLTEEEAIQMMEDDEEIEKGHKTEWSELPDELAAGAKKARQGERKANKTKREKKPNDAKKDIISKVIAAVPMDADTLKVINDEREFEFMSNGVRYRITLACPRK